MTSVCTIHNVEMSERLSKNKFDDEGNPKKYFAHTLESGGMCFGEGLGKTLRKATSAPVAASKPVSTDVMGKVDWNKKEFVKGLGVFSAAARQEGMDPVTAFRDMHIADWLRVAYGDMEGYDDWILGVKARISKLAKDDE